MRLRNIPRAGKVLQASPLVIKDERRYKGRWKKQVFQNTSPLHVEIGMGKGQFLTTLAQKNPDINYIGIERYSSVLLRAVEKFAGEPDGKAPSASGLFPANLRFLCMDAASITEVFAKNEVNRIYLNFSDPWPKSRHARRRLTSSEYLKRYDGVLSEDGTIIFKTDNKTLFDFSVEQIEASDIWKLDACTYDLHRDPVWNKDNIMTEYEAKFSALGNPIFMLAARRG